MVERISPFQKENVGHLKEERTAFGRFRKFVYAKVNEMFLNAIPSPDIKDMPVKYTYCLGFLLFFLLFCIFVVLFLTSYASNIDTQFLSPLSGTVASDYCETISTSSTGNFLATKSGLWQGANNFQYAEAAYEISLTSYSTSVDEYESVMDSLYTQLVAAGNFTAQHDLTYNLLYWSSFTAVPDLTNPANRFTLVGDPSIIFNRQVITGTISSYIGDCNVSSVSNFDAGKSYLTTT